MTDKQRQRIESEYVARHANARTLLDEIRQLLSDLPAPEDETEIHWGHVGDLGHVNELLEQTAAFLRNDQ